ncbi:CobN/Magnesium Chelatase [Desulfofundulus australicus DSM 11792]|uniref:CobN/Magnesium Chelatase n=1 Tax=Desulfofundulus australicus DSM 11792 TaxID=1121425 RepID=A0A1M5A953_9FIRM|nr:ABC transporter ATP-binding protein [Desulfofundulus australicus]SHF26402.1 CobN/Magnesium Chelatase [Desulfofundulus australicus DSM 11792]
MLARALAQEPELIILDEPTTHLDVKHRLEVMAILRQLTREKGIAVILSLHEIDLALKSCAIAMLVKDGKILACGPPEEVLDEDTVTELYDIDSAYFSDCLGGMELRNNGGAPVYVLGGAGSGARVYRMLSKHGFGVVTGVIHENDVDYHVGKAIGATLIEEKSFEEIGDSSFERAVELIRRAARVIDAGFPVGSLNLRNLDLIRLVLAQDRTVYTLRGKRETEELYGEVGSQFIHCHSLGDRPVMTRAGSYDELAEIEVLLKEYNEAKMMDASRLPSLHNLIWEKVALTHLDQDLKITREAAEKDWEDFLERLHSYLHEIKDTLIRDGLHILGQPPAGETLVEMLLALTRLPNGPVPSLREQVASIKGFNYEQLLSNPGYFDPDQGRTYGEMLDEIEHLARRLLEAFVNGGYTGDEAPFIVQELLGKQNEEICRVLEYTVNTLVPALAATKQELDNCLNALAGGFVPPGPSGAPTRGMADILPTGRNFYSVDPQAVPSRAAWQVGCSLADALLERYRQEKGTYPRSVGIVVWATSNMRTGGDDIAQALYLMGVRPYGMKKAGELRDWL